MFATFDDRGRLFVSESSGLDLYAEISAGTRRCRVSLLEDRDGDGGYEIHRVIACSQCGEESTESLDSCWGFFGLEYCRTEANAALGHRVAMCYQENSPEERPA